jgi:hypothetical protein
VTVGIAVVANRLVDAAEKGSGANAIVLVADKQITRGTGGLKADVEVEKKLALRSGWQMLFAGTPSDAVRFGFRINNLPKRTLDSPEYLGPELERVYQEAWDEAFDLRVLRRNALTRRLVVGRSKSLAPLPPLLLAEYYRSRIRFEEDFACDMILAGFDAATRGRRGPPRAWLVTLIDGTAEIDQHGSFRAIGEADDVAIARLTELNAQASDPLHVALYNALIAKFASEHVASVGPGTDAWLLVPGIQPHRVDHDLIADIRDVAERRRRDWDSFHKRPLPLPVPGWQKRLVDYAAEVVSGGKPAWAVKTSSPSARGRLS